MKFPLFLILLVILNTSCSNGLISQRSSSSLPTSIELKSYALVLDENTPNLQELKEALHKEMALKNYYYDPVQPDVLVMGKFYNEPISLLTGTSYQNTMGETQLEAGKVKTKKNALLIQLLETQSYATLWRGFSSSNALHADPFQISYTTRALLND